MLKNSIKIQNLENYKKYQKLKKLTISCLEKHNFLQLDLPVLSPSLVPEESIEIFSTVLKHHQKEEKLFLTPSPELFIKRLLVYGVGDCFYLGKAFRNYESLSSSLHLVEFEILEIYQLNQDLFTFADNILRIIREINYNFSGEDFCYFKNKKISFENLEKISVEEAFEKFANIRAEVLFSPDRFLYEVQKMGYKTTNFTYEEVFSQIYADIIEPNLGKKNKPTIIYNFPKNMASLSKLNSDGETAQRFEMYIEGVEIANCFAELSNFQEQETRFKVSQKERKKNKMQEYPTDQEFLEDLRKGLPESCGIAIGFERLAMIILNLKNIKDLKLITLEEV